MTSPDGTSMRIEWDVPIEMGDGTILRADIFRPAGAEPVPVILSHGPYGKWLHFEDGSPYPWSRLKEEHPTALSRTSNRYQSWEVADPEAWVPEGFACVRVDSRGAGRSPGRLDPLSPQEVSDLYACIEWAGTQPWCNGRVGLSGISYYSMNQWQVAAQRPPHLAAMCAWEGASDLYREMYYHGGIRSTFAEVWYEGRILPRQHGLGARGSRSRLTGDWVSGPETLAPEALEAERVDLWAETGAHPLVDEYWKARVPDLEEIEVPLLSAGNWGGMGLHLRGNVEGFARAGSRQKWLELHGRQHWTEYYTERGFGLQREFFGHFLKGEDNGWDARPAVLLRVRHPGERFVDREEREWPLARTRWTPMGLDPTTMTVTEAGSAHGPEGKVTFDPMGPGLTFLGQPLAAETEITGPSALRMWISSASTDADLFVILRAFGPDLREVTFHGSNDPHTPIAHGWLRASRRHLDEARSLLYRPFHSHDRIEPLVPDQPTELQIEIWPTSVVLLAGWRIGLSIRGNDYLYPGANPTAAPATGIGATAGTGFTGVGPFRHTSAVDRPPSTFGAPVTVHWSPEMRPELVLPVIPTMET